MPLRHIRIRNYSASTSTLWQQKLFVVPRKVIDGDWQDAAVDHDGTRVGRLQNGGMISRRLTAASAGRDTNSLRNLKRA
ncbi:hypothetical protein A6U89_30570 [Agrobacterium sp. B133/95]|uniref:Uncharacterized protein n=1 Tax=Rhizobium rhizogenes (strain K84 / ATCC BAA-868) TaxID=311403 RepID=B9JQ76_RHIR8|nr:hypothetical protein Arad_12287 [Rhizobium rhizogenes K84]OCJ22103.1 hypothetical protein A6U88_30770 [Agrobacterium sp. B131/95]OCJ24379.1 hypothetical protein A6U89_30570 [Agrobacterium sp. B133/95]